MRLPYYEQLFRDLPNVDSKFKRRHRSAVRYYAEWHWRLFKRAPAIGIMTSLFGLALILRTPAYTARQSAQSTDGVNAGIAGLIILVTPAVIFIIWRLSPPARRIATLAAVVALSAVAFFLVEYIAPRSLLAYGSAALYVLYGSIMAVITAFALLVVVVLVDAAHSWLTARYADLYTVGALIRCLDGLGTLDEQPRDIDTRITMLTNMQELARLFERALPRRLRMYDAPTDAFMTKWGIGVAAHIRVLMQSVATPTANSPDDIATAVRQMLDSALSARWDEIKSIDVTLQTAVWTQIIKYTQRLAIGLMPLVLYYTLRVTHVQIDGGVLAGLASVGAASVLVAALPLDDGTVAKLSAFTQLIRGKSAP